MRFFRIFLLHFEQAFEFRSRNFVWFLIELLNPLLYLLFWKGAYSSGHVGSISFSFSDITAYYFLLIFAGAFLTVHIEEDVAFYDIKEGGLVRYLTRPFSYFWLKFFEEIPWRLIQGFFGIVLIVLFVFFFGNLFKISMDATSIITSVTVGILAYFLSFTFKMIVGLSALWIVDYSGLEQLVTVIFMVFAGFVIPLQFFPSVLKLISNILPFSYMIYYPVLALQGKLQGLEIVKIIGIQMVWLFLLVYLYNQMWKRGIKMFTGIGQ